MLNRRLFLAGCLVPFLAGCLHSTPPAGPIRIALLSDTHVNRGIKEDQPLYRGRFERAIEAVNREQVDLVLMAGDLTENGTPEELHDFLRLIERFNAPVWHVPGNHDLGPKAMPGKPERVEAFRLARYEMRMGRSYFAREHRGVRVIGMNSPLVGSELPAERRMWRFLERELAKPAGKPTILLTHYPPYLKKADEPGGDYFNMEPAPRQRLLGLLKQGGVMAVLSGHLHKPLVHQHEGVLLHTTAPVSFGLPKGKQPQAWTLVTIEPGGGVRTQTRVIPEAR